jgi:hypothetical protein
MSWDASDEETFERWEAERRARRRPSLRIRLAAVRGSCVPQPLLDEVSDLENEVAALRARASEAGARGAGGGAVAGERGAPGSEGRESAPSPTCVIRGCGVVALGIWPHCRKHQAMLDRMEWCE